LEYLTASVRTERRRSKDTWGDVSIVAKTRTKQRRIIQLAIEEGVPGKKCLLCP